MKKALALFSSLLQDSPNLAILHINNKLGFLNDLIKNFVDNTQGRLNYIDFKDEKNLKVRVTPREYKYVILGDVLDYIEDKTSFLKLYYHSLENSGNIIILTKKSSKNIEEIKHSLDTLSFHAINDIDIFENYLIITAKKMHVWGKGL